MITYPYDYYFSEDSVQTDIVITDGTASYSGTSLVVTGNTVLFTNENIDSEKMSLLETLCSDNTLRWGRCEASELKFTIHSSVVPLEGTVLNVYLYFNNDASTLFKIGTYKVDSDVATALRTVREITCYDALLDVLNAEYIDWYNALDFNTVNTIKKFRDAFFTHIGITQKTTTLVNDSATIVKVAAETLSGTQILNAICEINGRFGHIDRDNEFVYVKLEQNIQGLYPAVDLYPSPTLYPQHPKSTPIATGTYIPPLRYEKYKLPSITRLQIRTDDSDIGVVVGTSGTDYVIQGNFLTFNLDATALTGIANNILGEISGVIFQPFEVQMRANLCFEVGDAIRCNDDLTGVEGYVLYRNAVGIQAIIDTLSCMKERDYKLDANSVGYQFNAVNNRTASIRTDVNEVSATLTYQLDPTQGTPGGTHNSYAYQTAQEIGQRVTYTDFNYELDPTQAGGGGQQASYAYQTAQQIGAKVETTTFDNALNPNLQGSYAWQTAQAIGAKVDETHGNQTSGFSWELTSSGHTWYKDNQQVMKIDSNGLSVKGAITAGSTIKGASFECVDSNNHRTSYISEDGTWAEFADGAVTFDSMHPSSEAEFNFQTIEMNLDDSGTFKVDCQNGGTAFLVEEEYWPESLTYTQGVYIGCDELGTAGVNKVALNASTWVHIGVQSPSVTIGASGVNVNINGNVEINGSAPSTLSISDVRSDLQSTYGILTSGSGTTSDCTSLHLYLNSYDQLVFHSKYSGGSHISLNTIIVASGATKTPGLN